MQPIRVDRVSKNYGNIQAVKNVSFQVNEGEIFGLIGPDGAGKTTIMRMIVSLLLADSGQIFFMDKGVAGNNMFVRSNIGYMPQRFSLYQDLSVEENLHFFGDLFDVKKEIQHKRLEQLYEFSRLGPFKKRFAGALSGGMKQKLALSCMLMHEPQVMVLDEPTFGVDPVSRIEFWDILGRLKRDGITLIVSTPYMDEAERCDRIALIHEGQILALESPHKIISDYPYPIYRLQSLSPHIEFNKLKNSLMEENIQLFADGVHLIDRKNDGVESMQKTIEKILEKEIHLQPVQVGLENIFLDLMHTKKEMQ